MRMARIGEEQHEEKAEAKSRNHEVGR